MSQERKERRVKKEVGGDCWLGCWLGCWGLEDVDVSLVLGLGLSVHGAAVEVVRGRRGVDGQLRGTEEELSLIHI